MFRNKRGERINERRCCVDMRIREDDSEWREPLTEAEE